MVDLRSVFASLAVKSATGEGGSRKTTSIKSAQEVYAYAADYIDRGEPMPPELARFVAGALRGVSRCDGAGKSFGNEVLRALRLYRSRGYKKDPQDVLDRQYAIWTRYWDLRIGDEAKGVLPLSAPEAKEELAKETGLDIRRIEQIVSLWDKAKEEHDQSCL